MYQLKSSNGAAALQKVFQETDSFVVPIFLSFLDIGSAAESMTQNNDTCYAVSDTMCCPHCIFLFTGSQEPRLVCIQLARSLVPGSFQELPKLLCPLTPVTWVSIEDEFSNF